MYTQRWKVNKFQIQNSSRNCYKIEGMSYALSQEFSREVEYSNKLCKCKEI